MMLTARNVARNGGVGCTCCRPAATMGAEAKRQRREVRRIERATWKKEFRNA